MSCKKAVRQSMFVLMSLLATALMVEVRVACVAFFICAHRAALFKDCTSPGRVGWHVRMLVAGDFHQWSLCRFSLVSVMPVATQH